MNSHITTHELRTLAHSDLLSAASKLVVALRHGQDASREAAVLEREIAFILEVLDYDPL